MNVSDRVIQYNKFCDRQNKELLSKLKPIKESILIDNNITFPITQNVVITLSLGTYIDEKKVVRQNLNTEYKPSKFAAIVSRQHPPKTTALIFGKDGKIVCVGAKSVEEARTASQNYRLIISSLGYMTDFKSLTTHNKVCNGSVGYALDLAKLEKHCVSSSTYIPQIFPGLIRLVKINKDRYVIFLIFDSGKYIVMGLREDGDEIRASKIILPELEKFKCEYLHKTSCQRSYNRITKKLVKFGTESNTINKDTLLNFLSEIKENNEDLGHLYQDPSIIPNNNNNNLQITDINLNTPNNITTLKNINKEDSSFIKLSSKRPYNNDNNNNNNIIPLDCTRPNPLINISKIKEEHDKAITSKWRTIKRRKLNENKQNSKIKIEDNRLKELLSF
jgi:transcription initiation factor TFIID TATA-box-binding protein